LDIRDPFKLWLHALTVLIGLCPRFPGQLTIQTNSLKFLPIEQCLGNAKY